MRLARDTAATPKHTLGCFSLPSPRLPSARSSPMFRFSPATNGIATKSAGSPRPR
jgi:hypothetical protein